MKVAIITDQHFGARKNSKLFHDFFGKFYEEVLTLLKTSNPIPKESTHVKAYHTEWNWHPDNLRIKNFKSFILAEIERHFQPGSMKDSSRAPLIMKNFWANVYYKHLPKNFPFSMEL